MSHSRWYMWGQQREVFPGLDSGPNGSEGHYSMPLEKRPSADPTYTTSLVKFSTSAVFFFFFLNNNFTFIDKTHITVTKFKTKRKNITILQIGSKLHKDEKE